MPTIELIMMRLWLSSLERPRRRGADRGDVPGWVMITILSAVLVVGLIGIAGPKLNSLFDNATTGVAKSSP
jgi:hypothetical protein